LRFSERCSIDNEFTDDRAVRYSVRQTKDAPIWLPLELGSDPTKFQLHPGGPISMFKELAPLVRHRAVLFTVTHVEDDEFRVNVIPKKTTDGENDALTTPVSVTGTVEELDKELPQTLLHFVSSHLELKNSLERAKAEMEEASKAARAEVRKKSGGQTTKKDPAANSSKPAVAPEPPVPAKAESPKVASLFDTTPEPVRINEPADGGMGLPSASAEADEDEEILRDAYDEGGVEEGDEAA
jgi:PRTRC genetic system protein E